MADMENLSFHRKYRPTTMMKYIGNAKLKETARKAINSPRKPQVVLMYGDSGCGKTTFARLLAKEYCCENRDPELGACGVCPSCQAIDEYITTGDTSLLTTIQEINVSQENGKNSLNYVLEDMQMPSFGGEWKVYIFDECHKATDSLQNALLKPIEEPPENVLMIFCTTNPEKMLDTFLNRCNLKLQVQKPTVTELAGLLRSVCSTEQVEFDQKGLEFIANRGELTIRTALQNLQQVINEQNSAKYSEAIKVFEEISQTVIIDFYRALKRKDVFKYVTILSNIKEKMELKVFLTELKNFTKRGIYTINMIEQAGVSEGELKVYRDLFSDLGVDEVCSLLNTLLSFDINNLELELLMWGYSGLRSQPTVSQEQLVVTPIEGELAKEEANAKKVLRELELEDREQGIKNANDMMEAAALDAILAMGGTLVE